MPNTITPAAIALYCDQCAQPATQEIDWIELTDTLDERGQATPVCDSHTCWTAIIETIDEEFGGKVQQTRRTTQPVAGTHRRNHDIPSRVIAGGGYVRGTSQIISTVTEVVSCHDCGHDYVESGTTDQERRCIPNARRVLGLAPLAG